MFKVVFVDGLVMTTVTLLLARSLVAVGLIASFLVYVNPAGVKLGIIIQLTSHRNPKV